MHTDGNGVVPPPGLEPVVSVEPFTFTDDVDCVRED